MTCSDLSSLAVVVEEVPTPCAGRGAVGRVCCAQADSPCGGFAGMRRWPYVNGIAGPRVLRVRRWAESLGACSRLAACPPARRTLVTLGRRSTRLQILVVQVGVVRVRRRSWAGLAGFSARGGMLAAFCETRLRRQRWRGWCQLVIT